MTQQCLENIIRAVGNGNLGVEPAAHLARGRPVALRAHLGSVFIASFGEVTTLATLADELPCGALELGLVYMTGKIAEDGRARWEHVTPVGGRAAC